MYWSGRAGPGTADEETVTRGDAPPAPARRRGNKPKRPREATHVDLNSGDASHGTLIYDGVSAGGQAFQVLRPLARGGLGEVFVARDGRLNREVALKLIEESQAADRAEPGAVPARGRDHRRPRAPRHRAGLCPGRKQRRPVVLRHAAGARRDPQGADPQIS